MKPFLSIVIPAYNGANTITDLINNLSKQIRDSKLEKQVEISVTDDSSVDNTWSVVSELSKKYKFINLHRNSYNLGMDGNFLQSAKNARGKYVWYSGQDDLLLENAVITVLDILKNHNYDSLYVDYQQYSEKKSAIICDSMVKQELQVDLGDSSLLSISSAHEYFNVIQDAPSFLPATIIKRSILLKYDLEEYYGTHFIQYAAYVLSINQGNTGIYTKPLVRGLIPKNGWQEDGTKLFSITLGKLYAQYLLNRSDQAIPNNILFKMKIRFIRRWPKLIVLSTYLGLRIQTEFREKLFDIFPLVIAYFFVFNMNASSFINSYRLSTNDKVN